ncbi:hypothetical protein EW145_g492 [Phellinidium pouzarii]|uniref:Uncharacterized protein n=1 Tax=Phellinidium pouzarii TaxID=167371 RepID=A0A4S4LJU8_9AGAM|nr:hypothetical protein EW145_g492 [Phellinidium pouzarii]
MVAMEQPLTPPPSFRVLRVCTRTRTRTISDENYSENTKSDGATVNTPALSSSPSRGRTRLRIIRNSLTLNSNLRARPHLSVAVPSCRSPPPSSKGMRSPVIDDELIFQMSPIMPQSPTAVFFNSANEVCTEPRRVEESTMQTLSALWENRKQVVEPYAVPQETHHKRPSALHMPQKRTRTGTVTQEHYHHRGYSDGAANRRRERRGGHRPQPSTKTLFDLSELLHASPTPSSPEQSDPFLYSFPSFESIPLAQARQARALRAATKMLGHDERSEVEVRIEDGKAMDATSSPRLGPIHDFEDANFISHAFRSASLDPEKDDMDGEGVEEDEEGYFSSQRSSSVSSSATGATSSLNHSSILSSSLLASFPVRPASQSQSNPSSNPTSRSHSRPTSLRASDSESSSKIEADAVMLTRGRPLVAHSRRRAGVAPVRLCRIVHVPTAASPTQISSRNAAPMPPGDTTPAPQNALRN